MAQGTRFRKILVEAKGAGKGTGDLGDLQGVGETSTVVIPLGCKEHLHLMHQTAETLAMGDTISVSLEFGSDGTGIHREQPARGILGKKGFVTEELLLAAKSNFFHAYYHSFRSPPGRAVATLEKGSLF